MFDASELTNLQRSLVEEIVAEAIVALAISLVLIGWVSHWIVSPLKSLAAHMRSDTTHANIAHFRELNRSDEIGQLAQAYQRYMSHQAMQTALFNLADKALYLSKQSGRNQTSWADR